MRVAGIIAVGLALSSAAVARPAFAESREKLAISASVIASCRFSAAVPRMGAPDRARGTAGFSVECTRGVHARADASTQPGEPARVSRESEARYEVTTGAGREPGSVVASLFF